MVQALNLMGNTNCENLARQSVAALLNICNGTLNYSITTIADLQSQVNAAFAGGTCGALGATLDGFNSLGGGIHCNVVKSPNTTQSTCTTSNTSRSTGSIENTSPSIQKFHAYPNPFTGSFALNVSSTNTEPIQLGIYDMLGRQIERRDLDNNSTNEGFGFGYPTGIYNLVLSQATEIKTLRVIKE